MSEIEQEMRQGLLNSIKAATKYKNMMVVFTDSSSVGEVSPLDSVVLTYRGLSEYEIKTREIVSQLMQLKHTPTDFID